MISLFCLSLWITFLNLLSSVNGNCFNPNGTDRNAGAPDVPSGTEPYQPCNLVQPYSMCCRDTDKCLANGLCQSAGSTLIWRESCTDQSWKSSACLKLCIRQTESDQPVKQCPDGSYCCNGEDTDASQCCDDGQGLWIVDGQVTNQNANATTTTSSSITSTRSSRATKSTSPTITILSSPAENANSSSSRPVAKATSSAGASSNGGGGTNTGAIVGGVVGGVVALGIILAAAAVLLKRRRRRQRSANKPQITPMQEHFSPEQVAPPAQPGGDMFKREYYAQQAHGLQEADGGLVGNQDRKELDGGLRAEMEGGELKSPKAASGY